MTEVQQALDLDLVPVGSKHAGLTYHTVQDHGGVQQLVRDQQLEGGQQLSGGQQLGGGQQLAVGQPLGGGQQLGEGQQLGGDQQLPGGEITSIVRGRGRGRGRGRTGSGGYKPYSAVQQRTGSGSVGNPRVLSSIERNQRNQTTQNISEQFR